MGSAAASDRFVAIALSVGVVTLFLALALALLVLIMRKRLLQRERRARAVVATWQPLMFESIVGGEPSFPSLTRQDGDNFLLLWNQIQDGVRGEPRARLNRIAETVGARALAKRRLGQRDAFGRVLALRTLGHLGRHRDYADVAAHLDDGGVYLSLAAARALVHIDPHRAPADILPRLAHRKNWPIPLFASILREADAAMVAARFREMQSDLSVDQLVRVLPLVEILDDTTAEEALRAPLAFTGDPDVLCAALKRVRSPTLLPPVRCAAAHEAWTVRTQAASALGRVGGAADLELLLNLLCDPQWWVRYRAAQSLTSERFGTMVEIMDRVARLGDRFAVDIVHQALAECAA